MLEQLRRPKEQSGRFLCGERLADIEEVDDACKQGSAFPRADWGVIEDTSLLYHGRLVVIIRAKAVLLVLFGERHGFERVDKAACCDARRGPSKTALRRRRQVFPTGVGQPCQCNGIYRVL